MVFKLHLFGIEIGYNFDILLWKSWIKSKRNISKLVILE